MSKYTMGQIKNAVISKGYIWFDDVNNKGYDLNIVGIRNSIPKTTVTNLFDDIITVSYKVDGEWVYKEWRCTTEPGRRGVMEHGNPKGVAILVNGQYRASYKIGFHKSKYESLVQRRPVKVYRDSNKDMKYDETNIDEGLFGINIHKAGKNSTYVENWSEGCQVFKIERDFEEFMSICKKAVTIHQNRFTYTLIESSDIAYQHA
jgi:hypothetical protein